MSEPTPEKIWEELSKLAPQVEALVADRRADAETTAALQDDVRRLTTVTRQLGEERITRAGADARARIATSRPRLHPAPRPVHVVEWMTLDDPDQATAVLVELATWVKAVWKPYASIAACWPWHPAVVSELLAAQVAWSAALEIQASPLALGEWIIRMRPTVGALIGERLNKCRGDKHVDGDARYTLDQQALPELAMWWASCHASPDAGTAPGLTLIAET